MSTDHDLSQLPAYAARSLRVQVKKGVSYEDGKQRLEQLGVTIKSDAYWHTLSSIFHIIIPSDDLDEWTSLLYQEDIVASVEKIPMRYPAST